MTYTRAFSSLGCPECSLEDTFALAARHGIAAVELRALGGTTDLPAYLEKSYGSPAAFAARVRSQPVRVAALGTSLHVIGGVAGERAAFLSFLPWAEALGGVRLRVFDGGRALDASELAQAADTLRWWQAERCAHGWRSDVMVETHDSLFTAAALRRFLAAVPEGTALLWDTHHTWRKGGEDPVETWRTLRDRIVHLHVKDSIAVPSARHPFTYVLPGEGAFPFEPLRAALRADRFAGPVSLEWEKLWHPYLPSLEEALRVAALRGWW